MTYSSSLAVSRQQYGTRNRNAVSFRATERTLGPISNTIILIVLACLLGLMYLTQVTKTNAYGYTVNDLKVKQTSLQSKHDDLEVASARLQSLDRVKNSSVAAAMVSTSPTDTIN
jgi:hypothetical protein